VKAVVQRVRWAEVEVEGRVIGRIERGLLVYAGVAVGDTLGEARRLADKVANLRIFEDDGGKLNRSVQDARGGVLAISNFTLLGDARKGRRPALVAAAAGEAAGPVFDGFVAALRAAGLTVAQGVFGADMRIRSEADGPVNILLDMPSGGTQGSGPAGEGPGPPEA
jgi:D-tyrosyl-tRNA(Tyr) deacylase